jgi:GIY-YIG catalytic domain-containing protein
VRPTSTQTLRSRVIANHLRGNIGSSTFRFSLAALLRDELALDPEQRKTKVVLSREDNAALSEWRHAQLRMTWCEHECAWEIESSVIGALDPPLNLAGQAGREFHSALTRARADLRHASKGQHIL